MSDDTGAGEGKRLTSAQKRAIELMCDWSNVLSLGGGATGRMLPKRMRRKHYGGDHNPRLSEMAELAHLSRCRIEIVLVPLRVDEWDAKRALERARKRIIRKPKP